MSFYIKYTFFFILFFLLHYLEGMPLVGSISFAQLWKIPILLYLILYVFTKYVRFPSFVRISFVQVFESFFSPEILIKPFDVFIYSSKLLPLPLFYLYFNKRVRLNYKKIESCLYIIAQYILLSSLLTLVGWITPIKEWTSATNFGDEILYYTSIFGNAHPASSYFCIAVLVLVFGFKIGYFKTNAQRLFNLLLLLVGFISIFKSYVRTGWIMLVIGLLIIYLPQKLNLRNLGKILALLFLLGSIIVLFYQNNEAFRSRIGGGDSSDSYGVVIETSGSGRSDFWRNGIELWSKGNLYEILLGNGTTKVLNNNYQKTGLAVGSHSLFIDTLSKNGIIGFILLCLFYVKLYKIIDKGRSKYRTLGKSAFFSCFIFAVFQSEMYFIYSLLFGIIISLVTNGRDNFILNQINEKNKYDSCMK